ncbi:MAG: DUF2065 family protein [Proteobacteria bacterium]|nr:DUF2065 family protein [Pseudomonadota bacterium]
MLVYEGMLPFISPRLWRQACLYAANRPERMIRISGLVLMLAGIVLLKIIN